MALTMTKHFKDNWKLRVSNGVPPAYDAVMAVIAGSIRIQTGRQLTLVTGQPFTMLSLYWNPQLNIVVHIDPVKGTLVSVSTDTMMDGCDEKRKEAGAKSKPMPDGYVALTMHGLMEVA